MPIEGTSRYYLAGPMTGLPGYNFSAFEDAAKLLRSWGLQIISAHEIDYGETEETRGQLHGYMEYIKGGLGVMLTCDAVIFLSGWPRSEGCMIENDVAIALKMDRYELIYETHPVFRGRPTHLREIR